VDLVGTEPTTASMPFPSTNCAAPERVRAGDTQRAGSVHEGFVHVAVLYLYASDTTRTLPTRQG
jgi:hypothetical protein